MASANVAELASEFKIEVVDQRAAVKAPGTVCYQSWEEKTLSLSYGLASVEVLAFSYGCEFFLNPLTAEVLSSSPGKAGVTVGNWMTVEQVLILSDLEEHSLSIGQLESMDWSSQLDVNPLQPPEFIEIN